MTKEKERIENECNSRAGERLNGALRSASTMCMILSN